MGDVSSSGPGDSERRGRIEKEVEKEIHRRRRLLLVYVGLLVIPLGIGVGFLKFGRTDRDLVQGLEGRIALVAPPGFGGRARPPPLRLSRFGRAALSKQHRPRAALDLMLYFLR